MASLRARHSRKCGGYTGRETAVPDPEAGTGTKLDGCTCRPVYAIRHHEGGNKYVHKKLEPPANRQYAKAFTALHRFEEQVERGDVSHIDRKRFRTWADEWVAILEEKGRAPGTIASYRSTLDYAKEAFGDRYVHEIRVTDIDQLRKTLRDGGLETSTRNKHLRVLKACFTQAVKRDLAARNPVTVEKEVTAPVEASYFTTAEQKKLVKHVTEGVFRVLFRTALRTGMRASELLTLQWQNVDTENALIQVRRACRGGRSGSRSHAAATGASTSTRTPRSSSTTGAKSATARTGSSSSTGSTESNSPRKA